MEPLGRARWGSEGCLLVVPLELDQPAHHLLEIDAEAGESFALTDPAVLQFKIANGD